MFKIIWSSLFLWNYLCIEAETIRFISSRCDYLGVNTLLNMGLIPQFDKNEECPRSWKWPERKECACNSKGNYYNHGEHFIIKDEDSETSCKCNVRKGIRKLICENTNWNNTREPMVRNYTCESGRYYGNQIFWPENTCMQCICQSDFNGEYVPPFCHRTDNNIFIEYQKQIYNQCTPYYYNFNTDEEKPALCSPSGFFCNEDIYEISPITLVKKPIDSNSSCKIDEEFHPMGTVLSVKFLSYNSKINVNCSCLNPPLFTCINTDIKPAMPEIIFPQITIPEPDIIIPAIPNVDANIPEVVQPEITSKIIEEMQVVGKRT